MMKFDPITGTFIDAPPTSDLARLVAAEAAIAAMPATYEPLEVRKVNVDAWGTTSNTLAAIESGNYSFSHVVPAYSSLWFEGCGLFRLTPSTGVGITAKLNVTNSPSIFEAHGLMLGDYSKSVISQGDITNGITYDNAGSGYDMVRLKFSAVIQCGASASTVTLQAAAIRSCTVSLYAYEGRFRVKL